MAGHRADTGCFWSAEQLFTHDMFGEGAYGRNVTRLWNLVAGPSDLEGLHTFELTLTQVIELPQLQSKFYPAWAGT